MTAIRNLLRQLVLSVAVFEVTVVGGVAFFMAASMIVGYLPYSDRPGPGWYGPNETVDSLPFVWSWLRLNWWGPPAYGAVVFVVVKALSAVPRLPFGIVRIAAALLAAAAGVIWVAATSWVFALALSVQWAALVAGGFYGAYVLPRIIRTTTALPERWSDQDVSETWIVGPEYDEGLRTRLRETLKGLNYQVKHVSWGVGGSQDVSVWEARSEAGTLRVQTETYIGLSVIGPAGLVATVRQRFELPPASGAE